MGLRQLHTAETMFIDDGLTDGAVFPPSSNAVYDALQSARELPSVTAGDDGDVLTVVEGAWAKAEPSSPMYLIHLDETTGYIDASWNELKALLLANKIPYFISINTVDTQFYAKYMLDYVLFNNADDGYLATFVNTDGNMDFLAENADDDMHI